MSNSEGVLVQDPSQLSTFAPRLSQDDGDDRNSFLFIIGWALLGLAAVLCLVIFRCIWRTYSTNGTRNKKDIRLTSSDAVNDFLNESSQNLSTMEFRQKDADGKTTKRTLLLLSDGNEARGIWKQSPVNQGLFGSTANRVQAFFFRIATL